MADVFQASYHAAIPADAKVYAKAGERRARFKNKRGRIVDGPLLPCGTKVRLCTDEYYARIRQADGSIRRVNLRVTNQEAARQLRSQLQREADQEKAGLIDPFERHRNTPLIGVMEELPKRKHQRSRYGKIIRQASDLARDDLHAAVEGSVLADYMMHLRAAGRTQKHIEEVARTIRRVAIACRFELSASLDASVLERHLASLIDNGLSYRSRNVALQSLRGMTRWMTRTDRLQRDPFRTLSVLNVAADPALRRRRALTAKEFENLLQVTEVSEGTVEGISGPQRALLYLVAAWTGLRRAELAALEIVHLSMYSDPPFVHVPAASTKARRDDQPIPLHPYVTEKLRAWLAERQAAGKTTVFDLKTATGKLRFTSKMMEADCLAAGLAYREEHGVADFHSHRVAFITHLCRTCSDFSTVVDLARHRDPKLTAKVYDRVRLENRNAAIQSMVLPTGPAPSAMTNKQAHNGPSTDKQTA